MTFTVQDYNDFVKLLAAHPEWRPELRRLVLADELLDLPRAVQALTEAQQHAEERLTHLEEIMAALVEQVQMMVAQIQNLSEDVRMLSDGQKRLADIVGDLKGRSLESDYRQHAAGYFGRWLRQVRVMPPETLEETLEAALSREEVLDIFRLDLLVGGRWLNLPDTPEVWLAVEVAVVLNEADVARAWRRAELLQRAGYRVLPVVAGERITQDAEASARVQSVAIVQDGQGSLWDETLAAWVKGAGGRPTGPA